MSAVFSLISPRDHTYHSGGFSSNKINRVKPVHESDKSLDPSWVFSVPDLLQRVLFVHLRHYRYSIFLSRVGSWSVVDCAHIRAFTFSSQDHGRLRVVHISKHSPSHHVETLKITVGCPSSTYPSIHILTTLKLSRSRSVARRAHVQSFVQKLADMLDSMVHAGNTRAVGTSTRADACACASDPQSRLFEFTSL